MVSNTHMLFQSALRLGSLRDVSIRKRIFLSYIAITVFSNAFISATLFLVFRETIRDQTISLNQENMDQIGRDISSVIEDYGAELFLAYWNSVVPKDATPSTRRAAIRSYVLAKAGIREAHYVDLTRNQAVSFPTPEDSFDVMLTPLWNFLELNGQLIANDQIIHPLLIQFEEHRDIVHMIQPIRNGTGVGEFYIAGFDKIFLEALFFRETEQLKHNLIICNAYGVVIFDFGDDSRFVREAQRHFLPGQEYPLSSVDLDAERFHILSRQSEDGSIYLLKFISTTELLAMPPLVKFWIVVSLAISMVIALAAGLSINRSITQNIALLLQNIRFIENGHFDQRLEPKGLDEIGQLALAFNSMADTLENTIRRESDARVAKEGAEYRALQAEYNALQAKVRPHFLYNVLEAIRSMAKLRGQKEIVQVVTALGAMLRRSFRGSSELVLLSEELEYVDNYLFLQKVMLGERFTVSYSVDEEAKYCKVPRFILQPIVENAIIHGIEETEEPGHISIEAFVRGGTLRLSVNDNGKGMSKTDIDVLLSFDTSDEAKAYPAFGVRSVVRRIATLYGSEYGLSVQSAPAVGTTFSMRLPTSSSAKDSVDV